jgi:hypothetical protein
MVIIRHSKTEGDETMFRNGKSTLILKVLVVFLSFAMATAGFSAGANSARIIPTGKVSIIKDGKVVGEFSKEAPLPEGSLLRCEARCTVRLDDVYMVVEPDTVFSVTPMANRHELYVQEGTIYYSLSESSRPLQFSTPAGDATTGDLTMTDSELKGYVRATGNTTEIGVIGGGTMMLGTVSGEMAVTPGNALTIGTGDPGTPVAGTVGAMPLTRNQSFAIGAAGFIGVAAGAAALATDGGGGGSGSSASPSSP